MGYFAEWSIYGLEYSVEQIPVKNLTHLIYAFMLPNFSQSDYDLLKQNNPYVPIPYDPTVPVGTLAYFDGYAASINIPKFKSLKNTNPDLKILMSIGGWTLSLNFSTVFANAEYTSNFVNSTTKYVLENGFDGIDLDFEFPGIQGIGWNHIDPIKDGINMGNALKLLRQSFDSKSPNKHLLIAGAMSMNPVVIDYYKSCVQYFDYINIMTYDGAGSWNTFTGDNSPIYSDPRDKYNNNTFNVDYAVKTSIQAGFKPSQIVVGIPLYGRGWSGVNLTDMNNYYISNPSLQPAATISGSGGQPGYSCWKDLCLLINQPGWQNILNNVSKACVLYNASQKILWSYNDVYSAIDKVKYVKDNDLAGVMYWELSNDVRGISSNSIVNAIGNLI